MAQKKRSGRIDHVVVMIYPDNFDAFLEKTSKIFGIEYSIYSRDDLGCKIAFSFDADFEVLAPEPGSVFRSQLETKGEGSMALVFAVDDIEAAKKRAQAVGVKSGQDIELLGDEPWYDDFVSLKESPLDGLFNADILLGEIVRAR